MFPILLAWFIVWICGCDWGILGWTGNTWPDIFWLENCLKV